MTSIFSVFILLLILNSYCASGRLVKKTVTIAKCCPINETLTSDYKCIKIQNSSWDLRVYLNGTLTPFIGHLPQRWTIKANLQPQCLMDTVIEDIQVKNFVVLINGTLLSLVYDKQIAPDQYCLDYNYAIYCRPNISPERITSVLVHKCCGKDAIFSETNSSCISIKDPGYSIDVGQDKSLGAGFPSCATSSEAKKDGDRVVVGKLHQAQLMSNGSLWVNASNLLLPTTSYCLEHILDHANGASIITCRKYLPLQKLEPSLRLLIYPIGLAISAIFLAATLAAGSLLPTTHHVLHWRCQTNHVACLLVGDVLLCITQIGGSNFDYWPCLIIAVAMHFLFLAAFFWLNTMCFNIWWTFRDLRPQSAEKSQERIRLYLYEAYAWGLPFLIVFIGAVGDLASSNSTEGSFLRPRFASNQCWFGGDKEVLVYFYGPMGLLLGINLVLFGLTARELTCGLWKRELVKSTTERAALGRICAKLVVVMGVSWIMDVISWFVGGPESIWYFTDVINCLQGVFIFIVVGCQPQVLSAVKRSWCLLRNRENGTNNSTHRDHHSSSSQGMPSYGGDTLTNNSTITNGTTTAKSPPLETNC
ncbi:unnamed protein product [Ceutorhynchus assimilis]|uniref:G-protein coupled receptors family 2 profile 2 domain-containing protein n=1 Tax=Ceutorhynchus assimilis TaxID=467358 RepID=A0A9N9QA27_9CUCU|nr:unnamed protein product [Ceutorhynchus assimilis]